MSDRSTRRPFAVLAGLFALVLLAGASLLMWPDRDGPEVAETAPPAATGADPAVPGAATKDGDVAGTEIAAGSGHPSTDPVPSESGREISQAAEAGEAGSAAGEVPDGEQAELASAESAQDGAPGSAAGQSTAAGGGTASDIQPQPEAGEASVAADADRTEVSPGAEGRETAANSQTEYGATAGQGTEAATDVAGDGTGQAAGVAEGSDLAIVEVAPRGDVDATGVPLADPVTDQPVAEGVAGAAVGENAAAAGEAVPVVIGEVRGEVIAEPSTTGEVVVARAELPEPPVGDLVTRGATGLVPDGAAAAASAVSGAGPDVQTSAESAGIADASPPDGQSADPDAPAGTAAAAAANAVLEPAVDLQGLAASATVGESNGRVPNAVATLPSAEGDVSIRAAEAEGGDLYVAGTARPGTRVEVFADGAFVGSAVATATGNWLVEAEAELAQGDIVLSAEAVDAGEPAMPARVEASFFHAPDTIVLEPLAVEALIETAEASASGRLPPPTYVIIRRGDNLWRISRRNYGRGIRYEAIFAANSELIDDPDLIFPGQVFIMPRYDRSWEASVTN